VGSLTPPFSTGAGAQVSGSATQSQTTASIAVVIPAYNMDWCVARAVASCQNQSLAVREIIIVDDCSTDNTRAVVDELMSRDSRISYHRLQQNSGHLAALTFGAQKSTSDWIVLLDADDELTPNSVRARIDAANSYVAETGVTPQLVYGDHDATRFVRLRGNSFRYLCRELSLCQTSTIMLGKECIPSLPISDNPWNTDDEIVLGIGKGFHILHSGAVVTKYNSHNSRTRMSGDPRKVFMGVRQLVHDHRADILREHGLWWLFLWRLRVLRAFLRYQIAMANSTINRSTASSSELTREWRRQPWRAYRKGLRYCQDALSRFLSKYFVHDYF
jgi:glycosyltransferase involved in cell wall biosynthesis